MLEKEEMAPEELKETVDFKLVKKLSLQQHCEWL